MELILLSVLRRTLIAGTPLLLGTLGEIITERAGILNLGVEGIMAVGAVTGFITTYTTGSPWLGLLASLAAGALFALLHAILSITLQANQVISGLALSMLGIGISEMWGKPFIGKPLVFRMEDVQIPLLGDIPFIGAALFTHSPYVYIAVLLGIAAWFLLYHTTAGITLRSVGENPRASESRGAAVFRVRYLAVLTGGALAGLAGSHLSLSYSKSWTEGMIAGRGWIVIALTIFALWNPARGFLGAYLFGGIFVLQYLLQPLGISPHLLSLLPYISTLLLLLFFGMSRKRQTLMHAPAALGELFRRGER